MVLFGFIKKYYNRFSWRDCFCLAKQNSKHNMAKAATFTLKEDENEEIEISAQDVAELVPDADFRFCLIILKNEEKHFVAGTKQEVEAKLGLPQSELY